MNSGSGAGVLFCIIGHARIRSFLLLKRPHVHTGIRWIKRSQISRGGLPVSGAFVLGRQTLMGSGRPMLT